MSQASQQVLSSTTRKIHESREKRKQITDERFRYEEMIHHLLHIIREKTKTVVKLTEDVTDLQNQIAKASTNLSSQMNGQDTNWQLVKS